VADVLPRPPEDPLLLEPRDRLVDVPGVRQRPGARGELHGRSVTRSTTVRIGRTGV
jgi:hypothetical protein